MTSISWLKPHVTNALEFEIIFNLITNQPSKGICISKAHNCTETNLNSYIITLLLLIYVHFYMQEIYYT